jgi:fructose-specific component phosphotransferase system IIB-like protein
MTIINDRPAFHCAQQLEIPLAGDPNVWRRERLYVHTATGWEPASLQLHRDGDISYTMRDADSSDAAEIVIRVGDSARGQAQMESAIVWFVSRIGAVNNPDNQDRAQLLIDRITGALDSARADLAAARATAQEVAQ